MAIGTPIHHFSVSQLKMFEERCRRLWWITKVLELPEPETKATRDGRKYHSEVENYLLGKLDASEMSPPSRAVIQHIALPRTAGVYPEQDFGTEKCVPNALEHVFGLICKGQIDYIDARKPIWRLIDFKFLGSFDFAISRSQIQEDIQLNLYARVLWEHFGYQGEYLEAGQIQIIKTNPAQQETPTDRIYRKNCFQLTDSLKPLVRELIAYSKLDSISLTTPNAPEGLGISPACKAFGKTCHGSELCKAAGNPLSPDDDSMEDFLNMNLMDALAELPPSDQGHLSAEAAVKLLPGVPNLSPVNGNRYMIDDKGALSFITRATDGQLQVLKTTTSSVMSPDGDLTKGWVPFDATKHPDFMNTGVIPVQVPSAFLPGAGINPPPRTDAVALQPSAERAIGVAPRSTVLAGMDKFPTKAAAKLASLKILTIADLLGHTVDYYHSAEVLGNGARNGWTGILSSLTTYGYALADFSQSEQPVAATSKGSSVLKFNYELGKLAPGNQFRFPEDTERELLQVESHTALETRAQWLQHGTETSLAGESRPFGRKLLVKLASVIDFQGVKKVVDYSGKEFDLTSVHPDCLTIQLADGSYETRPIGEFTVLPTPTKVKVDLSTFQTSGSAIVRNDAQQKVFYLNGKHPDGSPVVTHWASFADVSNASNPNWQEFKKNDLPYDEAAPRSKPSHLPLPVAAAPVAPPQPAAPVLPVAPLSPPTPQPPVTPSIPVPPVAAVVPQAAPVSAPAPAPAPVLPPKAAPVTEGNSEAPAAVREEVSPKRGGLILLLNCSVTKGVFPNCDYLNWDDLEKNLADRVLRANNGVHPRLMDFDNGKKKFFGQLSEFLNKLPADKPTVLEIRYPQDAGYYLYCQEALRARADLIIAV